MKRFGLTQVQMAELFETTPQNVTLQLKNICAEGELVESATRKVYLQVRLEGGREVSRRLCHDRLEAVLAVGFRVRSHRGTQFRQWAIGWFKELGYAVRDGTPIAPGDPAAECEPLGEGELEG